MSITEKLTIAFPSARIYELNGGVNLYFDKTIVSVFFKNNKFTINGEWTNYKSIDGLIDIITNKIKPKEIIKQVEFPIIDNGVQKCIDHINKKIDLIKDKNTKIDNQVSVILLALSHELEQYK